MSSFLQAVIYIGVQENMPSVRTRAIILTNTISVIGSILSTILLLYILKNGWAFSDLVVTITAVVLYSIPMLNRRGAINGSRILLATIIPFAGIVILFLPRIQAPEQFEYIRTPGIFSVLLATSVIPILIFSTNERRLMFTCLSVNFLLFITTDVFLRLFSKLGEVPTVFQYLSSNLVLLIAYIFLTGSVLSLKNMVDEFDAKNEELIKHLDKKSSEMAKINSELYELNKNIETQNEEIQVQSEKLLLSQQNLLEANQEIERQKLELEEKNKFLEKSLDERNKDLLQTNEQLIMQNNELQQFSYTVSHNLRGPVASMLGLMNIYRLTSDEEEKNHVLKLIEKAMLSLENIIIDLNKIIDIRRNKFYAFEKVLFEHEMILVIQSLNNFIQMNKVRFETDFQRIEVVSVKAYINSILYNLISNAIQYRAPERAPVIKISTKALDGNTILEVADNGLGIDLSKFEKDLFKLYKRFHLHTEGKGLGLYLVKQQVENLNGRIEVDSRLNVGTTFRVFLPHKEHA